MSTPWSISWLTKTGGDWYAMPEGWCFSLLRVLVTMEMLSGILERISPDSAGSWLARFESTGIYDGYGVVQRK